MTNRLEIGEMEQAAYLLKAISNATRLTVISLLAKEVELSVSQLIEKLSCEQSLLSHHLTDMRAKGVLSCRKVGKNCFYSLKDKEIIQVLDYLKTSLPV